MQCFREFISKYGHGGLKTYRNDGSLDFHRSLYNRSLTSSIKLILLSAVLQYVQELV